MRVFSFDGELWCPAMRFCPINPDDVDTPDAIVDATIEPTIMGANAPIIAGKVLLRNA